MTENTVLEGARVVQLEVPDLDGGLRAKLVSAAKALSPAGAAMCTIMFGSHPGRRRVREPRVIVG